MFGSNLMFRYELNVKQYAPARGTLIPEVMNNKNRLVLIVQYKVQAGYKLYLSGFNHLGQPQWFGWPLLFPGKGVYGIHRCILCDDGQYRYFIEYGKENQKVYGFTLPSDFSGL